MLKQSFNLLALLIWGLYSAMAYGQTSVFINELHYDNGGTDAGEAVEVAGQAGTDLSGWSIELYNGNGGALYSTINLGGSIPDLCSGFGVVSMAQAGIQNGAPDGLALIDNMGAVIQFLSYEGSFTATSGAASGMTSVDIGVSENGGTAIGQSLQLTGTGTFAEDFTWVNPTDDSFGDCNTGQTFVGGGPVEPVINEFVFNHVGTDTNEYIEVLGSPSTDISTFTVLVIEGDDSGAPTDSGVIDVVFALTTTDANGFFSTGFLNDVLEEGTQTLLLVENFTGAAGDDLDTDDDGVLDLTPWGRIVDDVAVTDGGVMDTVYSAVVLDAAFDGGVADVGGASRIPNGSDTDSTSDWVRNDFDGAGIPALDPGTPELGEAVNTPAAVNAPVDQSTLPFMCGAPASLIHDVQGPGFASPVEGQVVDIEAVVVGDFLNGIAGELGGYFVQEEDSDIDADPLTSEGIFVFAPDNMEIVNIGDVIRVRGTVDEFFEMTEIVDVTNLAVCAGASRGDEIATPATLTLPIADPLDLEAIEAMSVVLPQTLTVTDSFTLVQFGEFQLSNGRLFTPTQIVMPGVDANNQQAANDLNRILVDDGRGGANQMPFVVGRDDINPLNANNPIRNGYAVTGLTGVMFFSFGDYKVEPTIPLVFDETANPRTPAPELEDTPLRIGSANVLNFFSTLDQGGNTCGPNNLGCRGADTASELVRQTDKIVANILAMDVEIAGVIEVENNVGTSLQLLVDSLNAATAAGTWDFIANGTQGTDAIKVGLIYQPAAVTPVGNFAILDMSVDPRFVDLGNRPVLAQTFMDNNGEQLTVAVNHLRSKGCGSSATGLNMDQGDGQGCHNETRRQAVMALIDWIATDPTSSGDPDFLLIGDFNAYAMEDPIRLMTDAGFVDLGNEFENDAYSFTFFGQSGTLDFALASSELSAQVLDTTYWSSNADELPVFDYNEENLGGADGLPRPADFYQPDAFRAADHDPVIVSLVLGAGIVDVTNPQTMLEVDRTFALADGMDVVQVMVQLVSADGTTLPNVAVDIGATGSAVLGQTSGITDANGQFITSLTNTVIESVTVSGQFDLNGDGVPETNIVNGFPRVVSFEDDEDFIFADSFE